MLYTCNSRKVLEECSRNVSGFVWGRNVAPWRSFHGLLEAVVPFELEVSCAAAAAAVPKQFKLLLRQEEEEEVEEEEAKEAKHSSICHKP